MAYESAEKKTAGPVSQPHADLEKNIAFFKKIMDRVRWLVGDDMIKVQVDDTVFEPIFNPSSQKNEIVSRIKEYKCVTFAFYDRGIKKCFVLSFHQPSRKALRDPGFNEELCAILNKFGSLGFLEHTMKYYNGKYKNPTFNNIPAEVVDPDDKWALFTPKSRN